MLNKLLLQYKLAIWVCLSKPGNDQINPFSRSTSASYKMEFFISKAQKWIKEKKSSKPKIRKPRSLTTYKLKRSIYVEEELGSVLSKISLFSREKLSFTLK